MALCIDTETTVMEAVDDSIREVFQMMANEELIRKERCCDQVVCEGHSEARDLTVVLGLTGDLQGCLGLSLSEEAAIHWTNCLVTPPSTSVDQNVVDAVGELGNMVIGGAKRRINGHELTMSLPSVFRTSLTNLVFPRGTHPLRCYYEFAGHTVSIVVALQSHKR